MYRKEGQSVNPHSCSAVVLGSNPRRLTLEPAIPPAQAWLLETSAKLPSPSLQQPSHCLSSGCEVWVWRMEHICQSWLFFFSTLRFFFDQPDWFTQSGYWLCNCRDEVPFHLSAWPLPKTCFEFLERLDLLPFLLKCLKTMFLTWKKKKNRLPLSSASSHQPGGFRLALHSAVGILK